MPKVKLKIHREAIRDILQSDEALEVVRAKGEAIADACNDQSSWGGYFTHAGIDGTRARARVWSADGRGDEARDNRLVRNLDAGS